MRFITVVFLLVTSFCFGQWTPYNVNMEVKGKFQADKNIYFKQGADSGKVWMCIDDSAGLGEWRTISGGGSTIDTSNFWNINGNSGTTAGTNFVGTTDSAGLRIVGNDTTENGNGGGIQILGNANLNNNDDCMNGNGQNGVTITGTATDANGIVLIGSSPCANIADIAITPFNGKLQLNNLGASNGYVLTSDAIGLASWQAMSGVTGATGATGATGETGATGATGSNGVTGSTGATGNTVLNALTFSYGITGATSYDGSSAQTIKADTSTSGINLATQGYADRGDVWVLISTVTASNSATVDFTGLGSGSYVIYYTDVIPTTTSTTLNFRYGTGGTPTYQTSNYAYSVSFNLNTGTAITTSNSTSAGSFVLHGVTTGTGEGVSGVLTMLNPSGTSIYHPMTFTANDFNGGNNYYFAGGGCWKSTTAVTAGRFYFSSGNISSGTFKIYKIK